MENEETTIAYLADGSSVHTRTFLGYFVERNYDVHLITYTPSDIEGVKIHKAATPRFMVPLRTIQAITLVRRIRPKILHAFYLTNNGFIGALSGFHPFIATPMGSDITTDPEQSRIFRFLVNSAIRRADLVHASDNFSRNRLMELGCPKEKIIVRQFGVDTNRFSPKARSQLLREKLGIEDKYSVLCARWWRPQYNVRVFVKAIPFVLNKVSNVRFILLGGGPLENKLRDLARKLDVYENISFIGKISSKEMPKYLASVDVYVDTVSLYRYDALGNVAMAKGESGIGQTTREVMACGTPQILSDMPGVKMSELFRGLTYRQLDHEDLGGKISQLLLDTKLRLKLGEESRKAVLEWCDFAKIMKKWEDVYHELGETGTLKNVM
jgi:glycosyltransferase involved in cell wall biosynthesis